MSFNRTVNNPFEDNIKSIIIELMTLSDAGQSSYKCKDKVINTLHNLINEAREREKETLSNFQLKFNAFPVNDRKSLFNAVLESLIEDDIKRSIIVAFMYILELIRMSEQDFVKCMYYDWSVQLVLTRFHPWVAENGGWSKIFNSDDISLPTAMSDEQSVQESTSDFRIITTPNIDEHVENTSENIMPKYRDKRIPRVETCMTSSIGYYKNNRTPLPIKELNASNYRIITNPNIEEIRHVDNPNIDEIEHVENPANQKSGIFNKFINNWKSLFKSKKKKNDN